MRAEDTPPGTRMDRIAVMKPCLTATTSITWWRATCTIRMRATAIITAL
jgi:hypothetical protein